MQWGERRGHYPAAGAVRGQTQRRLRLKKSTPCVIRLSPMKPITRQRAAFPAHPNGLDSAGCLKDPSKSAIGNPAEFLDPDRAKSTDLAVREPSVCQPPHTQIAGNAKRAILYARTSTSDGRQSLRNQIDELVAVSERAGWHVAGVITDEMSGMKGPKQRPGLQRLLDAMTRREADVVAAWSIDRISRSIADFVNFVEHAKSCSTTIYLHQQNVDSSTPTGYALLSLCSVLSQLERALLVERVRAGLNRARAEGKRLGRPMIAVELAERVRTELQRGSGIRATSRIVGVSTWTVARIRDERTAVA
jgi:DNA invertase Pin-like site-specific DNA recombinase